MCTVQYFFVRFCPKYTCIQSHDAGSHTHNVCVCVFVYNKKSRHIFSIQQKYIFISFVHYVAVCFGSFVRSFVRARICMCVYVILRCKFLFTLDMFKLSLDVCLFKLREILSALGFSVVLVFFYYRT